MGNKGVAGGRRDYDLLESWAEGKGAEQQRRYGNLARHYRMMQKASVDKPLEKDTEDIDN